MKTNLLVAAACATAFSATAGAAGPMDALKGTMKEGLYETKMKMEMGGRPMMPPGAAKQGMTFQHCVTQKDIDQGQLGKKDKGTADCEIKNFKVSGNTATYQMACKGEHEMTADNKVTFNGDNYTLDMTMAMKRDGKVMNLSQHMENRYLGPCKK